MRGTVRDAGGVVSSALLSLTNEATGVVRETVTNDAGEYDFQAITPGIYRLTSRRAGYKTLERSGLRISIQKTVTMALALEVGPVNESVIVSAARPVVETSTASQSASLDRAMLEALPSPGRNVFLLAAIIPTFNAVGDPQFNRQQDQTNASRISLGGVGIRANNYLVDGVSITDLTG